MLKSRIRKSDEDSNKKSRQLEKLHTAKESIALLRQKCLRLETALKEKEIFMKKFQNGTNTATADELKILLTSFDKKDKKSKINEVVLVGKTASSTTNKTDHSEYAKRTPPPKPAWNAAKDSSANLEIVRLKDSQNRLQNENRRLLQKLKEQDQEIKHLKLQLQRTTASANKSDGRPSQINRMLIDNSHIHLNSLKTRHQVITGKKNNTREIEHKIQFKQASSQSAKSMPESHGTFILTKNALHNPKSTVDSLTSTSQFDSTLETKVQIMRKNIAARKIQRSWRHHRKQMLEKSLMLEKEKAVILLQSVLRGHKQRLQLLERISTLDGYPDSESYNTDAAAIRHLWTSKQYPS